MGSLPAIATPAWLSSIRSHPHLPEHTWYLIAATTLCLLNRPNEAPKVFEYATSHDPNQKVAIPPLQEEMLNIACRMREALVKAAAVGGMPKTINALLELKKVTPPEMLDEPHASSPTGRSSELHETPATEIIQRGQQFFDNVYGKVSKRVMGQMDSCGTEDLGLAARLMYGYITSNTSILNAVETSFVMIAGLVPQDVRTG
ncbi:hypothetical protein B0H63DRAFT_308704 [Podospora didyma]|uniref:Uncharacterized protein n=1 Tax=Podospora didyma TaxID=330526 RepID=A0AAE0K643_9PEZI|nr:hypothetical protein B0H63DRAFT_308704 [Podospora didyma]